MLIHRRGALSLRQVDLQQRHHAFHPQRSPQQPDKLHRVPSEQNQSPPSGQIHVPCIQLSRGLFLQSRLRCRQM